MNPTSNLAQQMAYVLLWWLLLEGAGLLVLPLAFRLFRHLPDRGYALSKPLGLVAVNYVLWMASTLGFLRNTWSNILLVVVVVGVLSWLYYRRRPDATEDGGLRAWLSAHRRTVLASELVFGLAFALWALYKAYDPNIAITEKPMEFAFLNAIVRSSRFPPYDPWMSGYSISYYYFGYVMVATLSKLAAIPTRYAFNLGIATLFGLTASGAFSVVYNMVSVAARPSSRGGRRVRRAALLYGTLAALMIPLMGNLEGALEFAHANGVGVTVEEPGNVSGPFWEWLDVKNLTRASLSKTWHPTDGWWWWRASRVIHDKGLTGGDMEVIDEFPAFSFLLGDMHPHVLAYPFVFMVIGLALNLLLAGREGASPTTRGEWWLVYLCLGAIGFLNTWDLPFYFFLIVAAYALHVYRRAGSAAGAPSDGERPPVLGQVPTFLERLLARWGVLQAARTSWLGQVAFRAFELGLMSVALYLPYWLYSRPQAGAGILPNLFNVSRFVHLFLMFGTFLVVLAALLCVLYRELRQAGQVNGRVLLRQGLPLWLGTMLFFPLLLALVLVPLLLSPTARSYIDDALASPEVQDFLGPQTLGSLLRISLRIRAGLLPPQLRQIRLPAGPWTFLIVSLLLAAVLFYFVRTTFPRWLKSVPGETPAASSPAAPAVQFALLLAFVGLMLIFSVEFVYLRDGFGTRMNTVFKFYFQAWALLGLTAAFGFYYVLERSSVGRLVQGGLAVVFYVLLAAGLLYPLGASITRGGEFAGPANLDGLAFVARDRPDEHAAVVWLNEHAGGEPGAPPVIVEAVRGSFSYEYARFSSRTGLPAVMGWTGHESTWHGLHKEISLRERDVQLLYGGSVQDTRRVLDKYDVSYVILGYLEQSEFPDAQRKLDRLMDVAFREGNTTIYKRR